MRDNESKREAVDDFYRTILITREVKAFWCGDVIKVFHTSAETAGSPKKLSDFNLGNYSSCKLFILWAEFDLHFTYINLNTLFSYVICSFWLNTWK